MNKKTFVLGMILVLVFFFAGNIYSDSLDKRAIGEVCKSEGNGKAYSWFDNESPKMVDKNSILYNEYNFRSEDGSRFGLFFPATSCDISKKEITLWTYNESYIKFTEISDDKIEHHVGDGTYRISKAKYKDHDVIKKHKTLIVETKRIKIIVIASDFFVEETSKATIVTSNKDTQLNIVYNGKTYLLHEFERIVFKDGYEPYIRKITEQEILQMIQELESIQLKKSQDNSSTSSFNPDSENKIKDFNDKKNENPLTRFLKTKQKLQQIY